MFSPAKLHALMAIATNGLPLVTAETDVTRAQEPEACPAVPFEQEPATFFQFHQHVFKSSTSGGAFADAKMGAKALSWMEIFEQRVRLRAEVFTRGHSGLSHLGRRTIICSCFAAPAMLMLCALGGRRQRAQVRRETGGCSLVELRGRIWCLQACTYIFGLLFTSTLSVVIPDSYELARDVGLGSTFSGLLIGAPTAFSIVLLLSTRYLMDPWNQRSMRCFCICSVCCGSSLSLAFAVGANPPQGWHLGNNARVVMIMGSRLAMGLVGCAGPTTRIMVQKVTPARDYMMLNVHRVCFVTLGIGGGPLFATLLKHLVGARSIGERAAWPMLAMSLLWAVLALMFCLVVPSSIEELVGLKSKADAGAQLQAKGGASSVATVGATMEAVVGLRKKVWALSLVFGMERALVVAALESSTSLILELEFGCNTADIGLMIGACFLLGAPTTVCMSVVRNSKWSCGHFSDAAVLCGLAMISLAATVLFLLGWNMWLILAADAIIFPSGYLANGIVDGFATLHAMDDTFYSRENAALFSAVLQGFVGRFLGPTMARFIADLGGRRRYAQAQMVLCAMSLVTAWQMRSTIHKIQSQSSKL